MAWQSRPIFVSSTFADMQAERDHLRTHVFPGLEERLRSRRRHLEWVDLRLGVVAASYRDAEMRELQVLKVCLGEVQRCRPFLIVLLGDRYGWIPPPERIAAAAREVGFDENITGRSVTDLEIQFGILGDKEQQPRCFFYFRQPLPYADMPPEVAATYADTLDTHPGAARRSKQLAVLKGEIEARLPQRVRRYTARWDSERQCVTGLDAWGQTVLEDIWSEILATTAPPEAEAEISWQQAERNALDDYIEDRTRDFVGRGDVLSRLEELASSPTREGATWGLCLTAPPGSGKSAIFGEAHRRLTKNGVFVLAHAAAASARATSVDDMLRRWIEELGAALGTNPGLADNADPNTLDAAFQTLLGRMAVERRVVVLVDALDQFEATTRGRFATWLPRLWPANARLIATAVPCEASKALEARAGVEPLTLPPLDTDEARRIAQAICARYHRTLEPEVLDALLAKRGDGGPAWGNTLWLVLAVEELNLVDGDDFRRAMRSYTGSTAEQLRALMLDIVADLPADVLGLYAESFDRAEKLFGTSLAQAFLGFIAISRAGWRESDFRVMLPRATGEAWDELHFASLRRLFRGQIRQRGVRGQWDVNHAQMRAAIRQYLRRRSVAETRLHGWAAQHLLLSLPSDDPLRQSETMVHLLGSPDWLLAAEFYGGVSLSDPELEGATRVLGDVILASCQVGEMSGLDQVLNILRAVGQTSGSRAATIARETAHRFLWKLDEIIENRAQLTSRASLLGATRKAFERLTASDPADTRSRHDLSCALIKIGLIMATQGRLSEAFACYRQSQDITERLAKADPSNAEWQSHLAVAQITIGNALAAQGELSEALTSYRQGLKIAEHLAISDPDNATWQRDLCVARGNIGDAQRDQGQLSEALASYRQSLEIAERLAASNPANALWQRDLSAMFYKIGNVLVNQGQLSEALTSHRQSQNISERLARADPGNAKWQFGLAVVQGIVGDVLVAQGQLSEALASYEQSRCISERLVKSDPSNAEWQHNLSIRLNNIGLALVAKRQLSEALESYGQSRNIVERLAKADPSNAQWQSHLARTLSNIGDVQVDQGQLSEALTSYRQGRDIAARLAKSDPSNATWQSDLSGAIMNVGDVLTTQGALSKALTSYRLSLDIKERLAKADPDNTGWRRDVSVARSKIGDVLLAQGQSSEALTSYRLSLDIRARLAKADPDNAGWQRDLSFIQERIGDVQLGQGELSEAFESYRQSRDITERLAKADPDNATWQRDLALAIERLAAIKMQLGEHEDARDLLWSGRHIIARLKANSPNMAVLSDDLARCDRNIAKLEGTTTPQVRPDRRVEAEDVVAQHNAALSYTRIGDGHLAEGNLGAAVDRYQAARSIFQHLAEANPGDIETRYNLGLLHGKLAEAFRAQGDIGAAIDSYQTAGAVFQSLASADRPNIKWRQDLAITLDYIGGLRAGQGDFEAAINSFNASLLIRDDLIAAEPDNAEQLSYLGDTHRNMGAVQQAQGRFGVALARYDAALSIRKRLLAAHPDDSKWQYHLVTMHNDIGDLHRHQRNVTAALDSYRAGLAVAERLAATHPDSADWQRVLVASLEAVAPLQAQLGLQQDALYSFRRARDILLQLQANSPGDAQLSEHLSWADGEIAKLEHIFAVKARDASRANADASSTKGLETFHAEHFKAGDMYMQRGEFARAVAAYQASHAIIDRLIAANPKDNAALQALLLLCSNRLGNAYRAQGDLPAALKTDQASHAIIERLAIADPENPEWAQLLSLSYCKIGEAHQSADNLPEALAAYKAAYAVCEAWAKSDTANIEPQHTMYMLRERMEDVHKTMDVRPWRPFGSR